MALLGSARRCYIDCIAWRIQKVPQLRNAANVQIHNSKSSLSEKCIGCNLHLDLSGIIQVDVVGRLIGGTAVVAGVPEESAQVRSGGGASTGLGVPSHPMRRIDDRRDRPRRQCFEIWNASRRHHRLSRDSDGQGLHEGAHVGRAGGTGEGGVLYIPPGWLYTVLFADTDSDEQIRHMVICTLWDAGRTKCLMQKGTWMAISNYLDTQFVRVSGERLWAERCTLWDSVKVAVASESPANGSPTD